MFYLLTINYLAYPGGQGKDRSPREIDTIHLYKISTKGISCVCTKVRDCTSRYAWNTSLEQTCVLLFECFLQMKEKRAFQSLVCSTLLDRHY